MIEPCSTCKHADPPKEGHYYCAAHEFTIQEDIEIFPIVCAYYKKKV